MGTSSEPFEAEVIDLEDPGVKCQKLRPLDKNKFKFSQLAVAGWSTGSGTETRTGTGTGSVTGTGSATVCEWTSNRCFSVNGSDWIPSDESLSVGRMRAASCPSPYPGHRIFVSGGIGAGLVSNSRIELLVKTTLGSLDP